MTHERKLNLSRRKVLGGLGTIGVASAGAGLGTTAWFNDTESFNGNEMVAGELDLKVGWQQVYYGGAVNATDPMPALPREGGDNGAFVNAHPDGEDGDSDGRQDVVVDGTTYKYPSTDDKEPKDNISDLINALSCSTIGEEYSEDFDPDGDGGSLVELSDVKPGDGGQIWFNLCLCDNPGYIWLFGDNFSQEGGANPEPEGTPDDGELAEKMDVYVAHDNNCDSQFSSDVGDEVIWQGKLQELIDMADGDGSNGLMLFQQGGDEDPEMCFDGDSCHCFNIGWEVSEDVGNIIQGDKVEFDLGFYTEQCRHNSNPEFNVTDV